MSTYEDQIHDLEEEIRRTKINKSTEGHVGRLKAKIAKLKRIQQEKVFGGGGRPGEGYDVKKSGDSSVALIGLPSVGKSTLLNRLCGQDLSEVGAYEFTTLEAIPGVMYHEGATVQVIDLPGIISGASKGKGRGKRVLGVARSADLLLIILDVFEAENHLRLILDELFYVGIRVNAVKPDIVISKTMKGGIAIASLKNLSHIDEKTIKIILTEYKLINADVTIRSDITIEELIDTLEGNRVYIPAQIIINKIDLVEDENFTKISRLMPDALKISAETEFNVAGLKDQIIEKLKLIKIFMRPHGGEIDYEEPLIVREGAKIGDVCDKLHRKFRDEFRFARVWGTSVKHPGQRVSLSHSLHDEDVLTIIRSTR
ncbi:MAG: OBG GTPase family GTP-binding protein [Candidatus Kariarchaeaceae archaeon]